MTDKQIIIYKKECYNEPYCSLNQVLEQLKRKEQECEELKKLLKVRIEDLCDSCGASSMMPMPCKVYEKTLTEIKEIAENCCINQATLDCENYDDCTQCGRISDGEGIQQILQKISECE